MALLVIYLVELSVVLLILLQSTHSTLSLRAEYYKQPQKGKKKKRKEEEKSVFNLSR